MAHVYLMLGSNEGDCKQNITDALQLLSEKIGNPEKVSRIYVSEPWGYVSENKYYNCGIVVNTPIDAQNILGICLKIEVQLGRIRNKSARYNDRTIDIDILFYEDEIVHTPSLTIPHARIAERRFALTILNELNPLYQHPVLHKSVAQLLEVCADTGNAQAL